jgi:hypothetical protein
MQVSFIIDNTCLYKMLHVSTPNDHYEGHYGARITKKKEGRQVPRTILEMYLLQLRYFIRINLIPLKYSI